MSRKVNYFKIGLFMLAAMTIFFVAIVIFGAGQIFQDSLMMETYFKESVQGIDIGTPIKFRGVKVGEVNDITIVDDIYRLSKDAQELKKESLYVVVRGALTAGRFQRFGQKARRQRLEKLIYEEGLRAKLVPLGITGLSYVELDFVDPSANPPLVISWEPKYVYIPSVPSTIQQLTESLTMISKSINEEILPFIENLNDSSQYYPDIARRFNDSLGILRQALANIQVASEDFPAISAKLETALQHINDILSDEKSALSETLENVRVITDDLKDISYELKHNPSRVIFGDPPPKKRGER